MGLEKKFVEFVKHSDKIDEAQRRIVLQQLPDAEIKQLVKTFLVLSVWSTVYTSFEGILNSYFIYQNYEIFENEILSRLAPPLFISAFDGLCKFSYASYATKIPLSKRGWLFVPFVGYGVLAREIFQSNPEIRDAIAVFASALIRKNMQDTWAQVSKILNQK